MIAGIYFDSGKWFEMLEAQGCKLIPGKEFEGKTQRYFLWETPWGHKFLAPHHCTYWEAGQIIEKEITKTKPTNH